MGNRPQPEERTLFDLATIRRNYFTKANEDHVIDPTGRSTLRVIDNLIDFVTGVRARRQLAGLIEKGADVSEYMNRLAEPVGMKIVNLDAEREARDKVIAFPKSDYGA